MNITSHSIGRGFSAFSESNDEAGRVTVGEYYSPHGIVSCHSESYGTDGTSLQLVLHGRSWYYGDRIYRSPRALARLAAKFAREVAATVLK